jgi:hypothetical protein
MKPPKQKSHQINLKVNRLKRLNRRINDLPLDDKKKTRKQELSYELTKAGIKV